jgi:hypothetical protein
MVDAGESRQKPRASPPAKHRVPCQRQGNDDWLARIQRKCKPGFATIADAVATLLANLPTGPNSEATERLSTYAGTVRFRGWYMNKEVGYRRMTDEIAKLIVVRFDECPADELVARLKAAGFRYRPEYYGHEKVWTLPNSFEARRQVERFEALLTGLRNESTIPL